MKKITLTTFISFPSGAEVSDTIASGPQINMDVFNICATIFIVIIFLIFILTIVKQIFENRLKNKIIEKGVPEDVASSILKSNIGDVKYTNIKWSALMAGMGIGLTIINYTLPLGIHSLAIMAFSISLSFLGYYYFLQKRTKK